MKQSCDACGAMVDLGNDENMVEPLNDGVYCRRCYAVKLVSAKLREKLGLSPELITRFLNVKKD